MSPVTVFFEDRYAKGAVRTFGPTSLLRACVADVLSLPSHYHLKGQLDGYPLNGNGNVEKRMRECAKNGRPHPAVFVLDGDRISELLGPGDPGCTPGRKNELRTRTGSPDAVVVFLEENLEELIAVFRDICVAVSNLPWDDALNKDMYARDKVLNAVATMDREVRDLACAKSSSLRYLVRVVVDLLSPPSQPGS